MSLPDLNLAVVAGRVRRVAPPRRIADGTELTEFDVDTDAGRVAVVADAAASVPAVGHRVLVVGRFHRRFFRTGGRTAARTELLAESIVGSRSRVRRRATVAEAMERLGEAAS